MPALCAPPPVAETNSSRLSRASVRVTPSAVAEPVLAKSSWNDTRSPGLTVVLPAPERLLATESAGVGVGWTEGGVAPPASAEDDPEPQPVQEIVGVRPVPLATPVRLKTKRNCAGWPLCILGLYWAGDDARPATDAVTVGKHGGPVEP